MNQECEEIGPSAAATAPTILLDANNVGGISPAEGAEMESEDDWGPALFEEEEECVSILTRVQEALQLQKDRELALPTIAEDPNGVAAALDRLDRIITRYQESPHLLHGYLELLLGPLVAMLQDLLPTATDAWSMEDCIEETDGDDAITQGKPNYKLGANYDEYDTDAAKSAIHHVSRAIYVVVKTAGEKCCTSYFSNDVKLCEDVFYALRLWQQSAKHRREWEVRYCLLLWLSNLVLVPFSLSIIDSEVRGGSLSKAVLQTAVAFLSDTSKCREGAALLVARLLTRPDGEAHRVRFFMYAKEAITDPLSGSLLLHGVLLALAKTLKCGQRRELVPYAPGLIPIVAGVLESHSSDALVCKAAVKVEQRLALALLRGRSAPWKYQRYVAPLDKNLAVVTSCVGVIGVAAHVTHTDEGNGIERSSSYNNTGGQAEVDTTCDDEAVVENDEGLEEAIGLMLVNLSHKDTVVRWSAAKGVGRICDRLPRVMAEDVIAAVLDVFSNEHSDSSWHGGLLAVAELCRRSILHPRHLDTVLSCITQGLAFDLIKGTYSVGSHVRDAACYACWSIARAYDASDIEAHVHKLGTSLVVTSLFDREVHVRRAAAAAFQECVGRLGNFPDGIRLVTTMDFFSLSSLQNAYLHVAPLVAENASYRERMLEELVANKLLHWDRRVRCCAAQALGILSTLEVNKVVCEIAWELLRRVTDDSVATRHGAILGIAEMIEALDAAAWPEELILQFATLTPRIDAARLFRSRGGEYVRQACCRLLAAVAHRRLNLPETVEVQKMGGAVARAKTLGKLQEFFEDTWKQILEWLQFEAVNTYEVFAATYYTEFMAPFHHKVLEKMLDGSGEGRNPMERRGYLLAMGALPWSVISAAPLTTTTTTVEEEQAYFVLLLRATMENTRPEKRKELQDAESRRNAVRSLRKILLRIPSWALQLIPDLYECVVQHILHAMDDYAADRRGDVGSFVRLEAIDAVPAVVKYGVHCGCCSPQLTLRVVQALLKQAMEKLDRLRGRAVDSLLQLIQLPAELLGREGEAGIAVLYNALSENKMAEWSSPQVAFMTLARPLLQTELFAPCVVEGLVVSAGSLSLHIMQPAVDAFLHGFQASLEDGARLSYVLIEVAAKYTHNERVVVPLCVTISRLMVAGVFDESCHVNVVEILRRELKHFSTSIHVLLPLVGVLGDFCRSSIPDARVGAWKLSLVMIASRYPKVRAKMATDMYTALLLFTSAEVSAGCTSAMQHLAATQWDASEAETVRRSRDELYGMLNISPPTKGAGGDEIEATKKPTSRPVAGSYFHLVHEAGY
ncbi:putative tubulin folding cofactor D [Trypanosoma rangeli]|uniref:Putative tubulin folding cofactor D n=1 Tax=Trypanosoma rangeli TaxID=5698 RepID=A0A3R7KUD9_TRYRA|nr:putative tubulin folding cofactor D [Trypanosoma rangeli]RNF09907.1 putative tubulin folding cofactor D [Trypanosoma rangeli]|eukprot:RNF09907.1 putative tubulin folding cofactor D [Trypanosoma rangeli]